MVLAQRVEQGARSWRYKRRSGVRGMAGSKGFTVPCIDLMLNNRRDVVPESGKARKG